MWSAPCVRLYLSSFRLGDHVDQLCRLAPPSGAAVLIANALDGLPPAERATRVAEETERLGTVGYSVTEVDLATTSGDDLGDLLADAALVWVRGGNVFTLRHQLARAGADAAILDGLRRDAFCYGGYSAGVCVLGTTLRGLEACDDPDEVQRLSGQSARFDGLGILDRTVVPHLDTPSHFESPTLERVAEQLATAGTPFLGLRDGDVWLVDGAAGDGRLLPRHDQADEAVRR